MDPRTVGRREFVKSSAAAGATLVIGFRLPARAFAKQSWKAENGLEFKPNSWIEIAPDGAIRIWCARSEMGQGVLTAMPMIVAEELEADWERVQVVQAGADEAAFGDQATFGSRSVRTGWEPLRKAGAAAREVLIGAAAAMWGVPAAECRAREGFVIHEATDRRVAYGELTERAATLPLPANPPLKSPAEFRLLGRPLPRVDTRAKVTGQAVYGIDVRLPEMLYAAVARCPVFGGRVERFDPASALAVPGVKRVLEISSGVAVVADTTWAAFQGKRALRADWDEGPTARWSSASIRTAFAEAAQRPGERMRDDGNVDAALSTAARTVGSVYEVPYLAHACMEPMNCTARVVDGMCEIWAPTQNPQLMQAEAASVTGLPEESVTVHVTYLGGGFGRRLRLVHGREAVELASQLDSPVQVVWTREDDIQNAFYRPAAYHVLRAGLDGDGVPTCWGHRIVGPDAPEYMITMGADDMIYDVPNFRLERVIEEPGIPTAPWRGVGPSQTCFVFESFADELAQAAGKDPYMFRRELLTDRPRLRNVLDVAARNAGWGGPVPEGRHRGIAVSQLHGTRVAEVAEVEVKGDSAVRVHRVVAAVDCGIVINPDIVEAQIQGAIAFGLTAALYGEITIDRGRVEQNNFHDYQMLKLADMPEIEVHIVESSETPDGIGECGLPPIAPAVCNAVFAATGKRIRRLPIRL